MLPLGKVKEAERLLAEGRLSHRKIALLVGISRATVGTIAAGRRPDYEARWAARAAANEPLGPLGRCPGCGGLVHMPCRLCRVRQWKAQHQALARAVRQQTRTLALKRLVAAVWRASQDREAGIERERAAPQTAQLPAGRLAEGGSADCK